MGADRELVLLTGCRRHPDLRGADLVFGAVRHRDLDRRRRALRMMAKADPMMRQVYAAPHLLPAALPADVDALAPVLRRARHGRAALLPPFRPVLRRPRALCGLVANGVILL
jgi:hypothetical protein